MGSPRSAPGRIDLVRVLELLRTHITAALCQTVFATVRVTERQRRWTLQALVEFWLAVSLRAPRALSQARYETLEGSEPRFPLVEATPEAFFQRCQSLRPAFFAAIFTRFTAGLLTAAPARYAQGLGEVQACFAGVVVVEGSRRAALAHRLKLLWAERAVVLPGCLLAVYDLGRGLCRTLDFCADAAAGELARAQAAVAALPRDTLVLADRLYGHGIWFATLAAQGCWGRVTNGRRWVFLRAQLKPGTKRRYLTDILLRGDLGLPGSLERSLLATVLGRCSQTTVGNVFRLLEGLYDLGREQIEAIRQETTGRRWPDALAAAIRQQTKHRVSKPDTAALKVACKEVDVFGRCLTGAYRRVAVTVKK